MRLLTLLLLSIFLSGCLPMLQVHDPTRIKVNEEFKIVFILQDDLHFGGAKVNGYYVWAADVCKVYLDTRHYTHSCIGHEVRHCLEGYWHGGGDVTC